MALSNVLQLADFFAKLPLLDFRPFLPATSQISGRTARGDVIRSRLGAALWSGTVLLAPMVRTRADEILAHLSYLDGPDRFFLAHAFPRCGPQGDPAGLVVSGAQTKISAIGGNNRTMQISGLPVGYILSPGDFLSFIHGTRLAYHQIVGGRVVVGSNGVSPPIDVVPHIRPGAASGLAVTLYKPTFRALIMPGSINLGSSNGPRVSGISFDIQQTFR